VALTVIVEVPVFVSLNTVTCALPPPTAVTRPDAETVLTAVLLELKVITRPVRMLLFASRRLPESWRVDPTWRLAVAGVTRTDATGAGPVALTVMVEAPVFVSLNAVIVALPAPTAVTRPVAETVLTAVLPELHVTTRPVRTLSLASRIAAAACVVWPGVIVLDASETVTVATAADSPRVVTVSVALPVFDPRVAFIEAVPAATL
jgi:hypothetical protein